MKRIHIQLFLILCITALLSACLPPATMPYIGDDIPDGTAPLLHVHFIDVGQADSVFIELPNHRTMLIDAGNPENGADVVRFIKKRGIETIDYVIGTHPHADHIGGLAEVIKAYDVGTIYLPKVEHDTHSFANLLEAIKQKGLRVKTASAGTEVLQQDGLNIQLLAPQNHAYNDLNNYSAAVKLTYEKVSFLFTGDAEALSEKEMITAGFDLNADVFHVGHHGSNTSTNKDFLQRISPRYAVISCGRDNSYGHPSEQVLSRLRKINAAVLRTDQNGTITAITDGEKIKMEMERKPNT